MESKLHYFLLFFIILLSPLPILAQNTGNITVGTSITAMENSNPWRSPSGDFAFGFQQLRDNKDQFLLAIWFDKIPERTIVWYDNRSYPVPRGSTIQLDAADGLVLRNPEGRILYSTDGLVDPVAYGFMNDTGNFVLRRSDTMSLWESFRNPSDTILPTQTIEVNGWLISRKSGTNFSQGRFYASLNGAGDFVFNTKSVPSNSEFDDEYYSSRTSDQNVSNSGYRVVFGERGAIFVLKRNGEQVFLFHSIPPISDNYYRATLNFHGVFTHYYHPRSFVGNPGWTATRSWPDNICINIDGDTGSGACGYNNVCRLENQTPICRCPQGFLLSDPDNPYGDCKPNFVQSCVQGTAADEYEVREIPDTDWPKNNFEQINPSTLDQCRSACLNDCFCFVSIYKDNKCWKKKLPLSNGRVGTTLGATTFLKFRKENAQNTGNITVGTSITAMENSNPWRSPSGDFAFGFQQLRDNRDQFLLAIWFDKIPDRTIVWYDNRSYPVPRGSTIQLDATDGLVLRNPEGRILYSTDGLVDPVAYGFMNDTGNFVLRRSDTMSLWESFRNPSDTILPTQTIEVNGWLISRKSGTNFSQGRFYASLNGAGDFVFNTKSVPSNLEFDDEYYSSRTSNQNVSNSGYRVVFSERGAIFVLKRNGDQVFLFHSIPPISDNYYRATLNFHGVFTHYYHPRSFDGNPGWTATRSWPDNICVSIDGDKGSGACGYNNVCRLENQTPICGCPQGFSLSDPDNPYGDCKPNFLQSCVQGTATDEFEIREIPDTDWPKNDFEQINPSTLDQCRSACLNDCFCAVSIYRDNSCWKKKLPLSNGRVDTTLGATAFLKFRKKDVPFVNPNRPPPVNKPKGDQQSLVIVVSVLLGSSAFINILLVLASYLGFFLIYKKKIPVLNLVRDAPGANVRCFNYKELVHATNGFKEEAGRGAFGIVYKGVIPDGNRTMVAVKKLDRVFQDSEKEFKTEVDVIGQTHHKNLVRLIGFCDEGPNRLLVYEFMTNGTLASFLFGDSRPSWSQRTKIALGVARGLLYLHEECNSQIIHCDIKPQNILLDEYYNVCISDFGLAKLLMMNQSRTLTNIRGTKGYVAPEWFRNMQVTAKVDVYSFGVLLLEIITCRKSLDHDVEIGDRENPILTDWVWDCFEEGRLDTLVGNDEEALSDGKTMERFVRIGIWCIQEDASLRPSIRKVSQMLEGIVEVAVPPCPSPFTTTI